LAIKNEKDKRRAGMVFKSRSIDNNSYLIIRKIQTDQKTKVVHITIKNVRVTQELWDLNHVPVDYDLLLTELTDEKENNFSDSNYEDFEEVTNSGKKIMVEFGHCHCMR
jgi:hypothetical protein